MGENTLYAITFLAVIITVLTVYFAIKIYMDKKRELEIEIEKAREQLRKDEQKLESRIKSEENELKRKKMSLIKE